MTQTRNYRVSSPRKARALRSRLDTLLDADFFQALADRTRVLLLCCLSKCARACTLSEIAGCCNVDISVVSRHMLHLARAGLVERVRRGQHVLYRTNSQAIADRFLKTAKAFQDSAGKDRSCG